MLLLSGSAVAVEPPKPASHQRHYRVLELPLTPLHLNNSGEVTGVSRGAAAIWSRSTGLRLLEVPQDFEKSEAAAVNQAGDAVGTATSGTHRSQAFLWRKGQATALPGEGTKALAVNDAGEVVGESRVAGKKPISPVLWKAGTVVDLGACCGGTATGINNQGQVVGKMYDREGRYQAFLWEQAHGLQRLGSGVPGAAVAINKAGHVLVEEFDNGTFLYVPGERMTRLQLSEQYPSRALDFNDEDAVVGTFGPFADVERAFIWDTAHGFQDLNDLIPAKSGWKLESAVGVNDRGEIVGVGDHNDEDDQGFLLIPE